MTTTRVPASLLTSVVVGSRYVSGGIRFRGEELLGAPESTLRRVRGSFNPSLDIAGVLLTMYDERTNLGQQVARDIREFFQDRVYETVIPRNIRLGEAPSHGVPAILYDVKSRGATAYVALAREFRRHQMEVGQLGHGVAHLLID